MASAEGTSLVGGCGGFFSQKIFQVWKLRNAIFSTCHEIYLRKIDLEYENGKQLQVSIIEITESKENNSIRRLDVSGSTGPGGQVPPLSPPPLATALYFHDYIQYCKSFKIKLQFILMISKGLPWSIKCHQ